jgi:drug/metabolite transporter (DMT)-like permease
MKPDSASTREKLAGIGYMVLGIGSFSAMDAIGKWLVRDHSVFEILAVRSTLVTLVLLAAAPAFGGLKVLRSGQPWAQVGRSLCGVAAYLFFFTSVRYLPLADAVAVAFGGPFIVTALSVPLLKEHVDAKRWVAIAVGFMGMLLIVQPTGEGFRPAALLVIASSFSYALMMIMTRWMHQRGNNTEKTFTFVFYTFLVQAVVGWIRTATLSRTLGPPEMGLIAAMGALALVGHIGMTLAFKRAPASVVAPFEYTALVWATFFGFVVFGDFPGAMVWFGVAIIVAAGLYTIQRERSNSSEEEQTSKEAVVLQTESVE